MLRDSPLLLVLDLDETIVHVDEENKLKEANSVTIYYKSEIYQFITYMRKWFKRDNLFLVLWSAADDAYVNEIIFRLNLKFDLILGRSECIKCEDEFGVSKSISYLCNKNCIKKWVKKKTLDNCLGPIVYALIDDKADENTSLDDPYTFTFQITPMNLKNIYTDTADESMFATVETLYIYGTTLIYHCILKRDRLITIHTESNNLNTSDMESKFEIVSTKNTFSYEKTHHTNLIPLNRSCYFTVC